MVIDTLIRTSSYILIRHTLTLGKRKTRNWLEAFCCAVFKICGQVKVVVSYTHDVGLQRIPSTLPKVNGNWFRRPNNSPYSYTCLSLCGDRRSLWILRDGCVPNT
jgi:hypothetical protein